MKRSILRLGDFMETEVSWWFYYFHLYKSNCKYRYISIRGGFVGGGCPPPWKLGGRSPMEKIGAKEERGHFFKNPNLTFPLQQLLLLHYTVYSMQNIISFQ